MKQFLQQLISETDNTADTVRVLAVVGFLTFCGLSIDAYGVQEQKFDPQAFGIGLSTALAGVGAALWMKSKENGGQ